jgi:hypothetical protein
MKRRKLMKPIQYNGGYSRDDGMVYDITLIC